MTNPYRAMCAELVAAWDALPWEYDWLGNAIGAHGDLCDDSVVARARALLAHPTTQPVAVSERLPGPDDCDEQGRCWVFDDQLGLPSWILIKVQGESLDSDMHWLPANALPTPEALDD